MSVSPLKRLVWALALAAPLAAAADPGIEVLHRERSLYRNIFVYEEDGLRCMSFTRTTLARQSCVSLGEPGKLVFNYADSNCRYRTPKGSLTPRACDGQLCPISDLAPADL